MNNRHEYTIFDESGAFFRGQGGSAEDLAALVAVETPFEVSLTAYGKKHGVLRQVKVPVAGVAAVLQSWLEQDDFLRIDRITYKIAPEYLNRWVDVHASDRKPVPHGTEFLWEVQGYSIAKELTFELPRFKGWGRNGIAPEVGVTSIFIPEDTSGFYPRSFTPAWAVEPKKADQKSSFGMLLPNSKAEVQSEVVDRKHLSEADLRELGVPSFLFKSQAKA